ncbi:MAG: hypothetical protein NC311_00225 [Muribaculaceae bacterium]|nr:hypothetical protein [Muribaculaceae bacterium]
MKKFVWVPPSKDEISKMVAVKMAVMKFRRENPDWARRMIARYYECGR